MTKPPTVNGVAERGEGWWNPRYEQGPPTLLGASIAFWLSAMISIFFSYWLAAIFVAISFATHRWARLRAKKIDRLLKCRVNGMVVESILGGSRW